MEHQSVRTGFGSKIHRCWFHCDIHNERDMSSITTRRTTLAAKETWFYFFESLRIPNSKRLPYPEMHNAVNRDS